jgi:hypothetical protein
MEHHVGMHMLVKIHCYNNVWMSSWQVAHQTAAYRRPPSPPNGGVQTSSNGPWPVRNPTGSKTCIKGKTCVNEVEIDSLSQELSTVVIQFVTMLKGFHTNKNQTMNGFTNTRP